MHIDFLRLLRFRSCADVSVKLHPDLTVLVGENNGGKSNIIDALRLLTLPLNGRRDRYPEEEDLTKGSEENSFTISGHFSGMSDSVKGLLISAVPDPTKDLAIIGMNHETRVAGRLRGRTTLWAGQFDTAEPEPGSTNIIRHVYLPPLRDARRALGSGSAKRITSLLQNFLKNDDEDDFLEYVKRKEEPHRVIEEINKEIDSALGNLARGVRQQNASLGFTTEELSDVARDLRFRLADAGLEPADIQSSGLGYANLLFMATVIVELSRARESDLTLFLVEEPEAHLHPQLQMLVLDFLLDQARHSFQREIDAGQPEGRIQIVVTTHSPNLTAWVSPEHLVVVRSILDDAAQSPAHHTIAIPIVELGLSEVVMKKISRYLDVTRSAMLFGNRVFLVEGIAEAILLPVIAKFFVLKHNQELWRCFRGAVLVPIDGVDFSPYIDVLLHPLNGYSIADRVVVITDADPSAPGNRKEDLEDLALIWGVSERLKVFTNSLTLEHELFLAGNARILKRAFLNLHPRSEEKWSNEIEQAAEEERAMNFLKLFTNTRTRKGDYAQQLADLIEEENDFKVPSYLKNAILEIAVP